MKSKQSPGNMNATAKYLFALALLYLPILLYAQPIPSASGEIFAPFRVNPALLLKYQQLQNNSALRKNPVPLDTVSLPFFDDFSKADIYPDPNFWLDSNVFINRDYPIAPPTLGVATFDGASKTGCPYDTLVLNSGSFPADTLTSKPIDLSTATDSSAFLSFFWQAQGRGNRPDPSDSLLLDFYNPTSGIWKNTWFHKGFPASSPPDSIFRLVMIQMKDTAYLKNAFQFRFRSYATISGNVDQWNIDYVLLDKNRNAGDTVFNDVAFVYNPTSLLKNYQAMPWEQYLASEMKTNIYFPIRNNDTAIRNTSYVDTIFNASGTAETSFNGFNYNVTPYPGLFNQSGFNNHSLSYTFPLPVQDTTYLLKCILDASPDKNQSNNTLLYTQHLANYYAYDDGTVEGGYGLKACDGSPGQIAYKFTLNKPDKLYAVQMVFDWLGPNVNSQPFHIRIWGDNGGVPGALIYEDAVSTPNYWYTSFTNSGNMTNIFYPYFLQTPQNLSGTFYVGFVQKINPCSTLVNIGVDKNINSNSKMYYDAGSGWTQSALKGSWMIRPVFGSTKGLLTVPSDEATDLHFSIYPNPSNGIFNLRMAVPMAIGIENLKMKKADVYTIYGEVITSVVYPQINPSSNFQIDLSDKPDGIYFVRITDESGVLHSLKLILAK